MLPAALPTASLPPFLPPPSPPPPYRVPTQFSYLPPPPPWKIPPYFPRGAASPSSVPPPEQDKETYARRQRDNIAFALYGSLAFEVSLMPSVMLLRCRRGV